ncbi:unnamed protein product [Allacma fusca]|uniref:Kazal-like domain-containing protein n=1 Tax=Allacma fusca TaxID=39272 RepID=A0A8J2LT86_9HEXA|nr:unnamed protein product [Allacma fusca]
MGILKGSIVPLLFILVLSFNLESFRSFVINDYQFAKCWLPCPCLIIENLVCASVSRTEKHLVTYYNNCFFLCDAKCDELTVTFVHCGQCDPNWNFTKKGDKPDQNFTCLSDPPR